MAGGATMTVELQSGPVLRACLAALESSRDVLELLPEWHAAERAELVLQVDALRREIELALQRHELKTH